jgi:hypothetical protein
MQKKIYVAEAAAAAAAQVPMMMAAILPYPYRFEITSLDLTTGKVQWSAEYEHTFTPGTTRVRAVGDHLFLYYGNRMLGCFDLATGKQLWEDGAKHIGSGSLPLPLEMAKGRLIYASADVEAMDPETQAVGWRIEKLGKITGILVHDGVAVAIGEKMMAAVDSATGTERWRRKTHGHTTNLIWDRESDGLLYADWKGLHSVERITGKTLRDLPLKAENPPYHLRWASPECVLAIGYHETEGVSLKTGQRLLTEGKLTALFRAEAFLDNWPLPEDGQELERMVPEPTGEAEWERIRKGTLLAKEWLKNMEESLSEGDVARDVYQTESADGKRKIWWVDGKTNQQIVIRPAAEQHDVSRPFGNVYGVKDKMLWAARIKEN